ncbi:MAG: phosphatidylglycerol lysyltransferase domain-containing protein [Candidatus Omnitrophota bacterium]
MKINQLRLKDRSLFNGFLSVSAHELSAYSFANIYIWNKLYDIFWVIIDGNLCLFFRDKLGCFMNIAPLGEYLSPKAVSQSFILMESINKNSAISRIENAEKEQLMFFKGQGLDCEHRSNDYVYLRSDLAQLSSSKFKSKRSSVNYFTKNYDYGYTPFSKKYESACLNLYRKWKESRKLEGREPHYAWMLEDNLQCLKNTLSLYNKLGIEGRVVLVKGELKGFTFGYQLNDDTFAVLFEIADPEVKGLAQFLFREFCAEFKNYKFINAMDDSGLENLKKVKLSYHPVKLIPAYCVKRENG